MKRIAIFPCAGRGKKSAPDTAGRRGRGEDEARRTRRWPRMTAKNDRDVSRAQPASSVDDGATAPTEAASVGAWGPPLPPLARPCRVARCGGAAPSSRRADGACSLQQADYWAVQGPASLVFLRPLSGQRAKPDDTRPLLPIPPKEPCHIASSTTWAVSLLHTRASGRET